MGPFLTETDIALPTSFDIFAFAGDASQLPAPMRGMAMAICNPCKNVGNDPSNASRMIIARLAQGHTRI